MENKETVIESALLGATPESVPVHMVPAMANRHGLIAGATGTGKTVSLQVLAEAFSALGVPVFTADVKGDLSGIAREGKPHAEVDRRNALAGRTDFEFSASPTLFWDLFQESGHPIRTTVSEIGPVLLSHMLDLNETQSGVLHIAFRVADEEGLLVLDLKDLRALLEWVALERKELSSRYGNIAAQSVAAIQRKLLVLEDAGAEKFFGEPALDIKHLMQKDFSGRGVISVLHAKTLINQPRLYSTFLLWLLSELFEELDEVGDQPLPRLVFFFDEAHLLFENASSELLERIEQVVRLIRSRGVGVFFVTQHPLDIPDDVADQLGNRIQHALRAFTPRARKSVKTAAESFRANPALNAEELLTSLGVGEALVSTLDEKGKPLPVQHVVMLPPHSRIGPLSPEERVETISNSPLHGRYEETVDRESAYEELKKREEARAKEAEAQAEKEEKAKPKRQSATEAFIKSLLRSVGYQVGRQIVRGVLGSLSR